MDSDAAVSDVVAFSGQHARTEHIALSEGGAVATKTAVWNGTVYAAASGAVMRGAGRFVAQFTVLKAFVDLYFGVVADGWDCKGEEDPWNVHGHCFYNVHSGRHWPSCGNWAGMQPAAQGDRIVLLLDLSAGSMEVYKNGVRLGALQADGLGGGGAGYRWAVGLLYGGDKARFEAIPLAEMPAAQDDLVARHDLVVVARTAGERDLPLAPGTRLRVQGHGAGVYERLERKWLGANLHHIGFAGGSPVCDTGHLAKCPVSQTVETGHTRADLLADRAHRVPPHNGPRCIAGCIHHSSSLLSVCADARSGSGKDE